MTHKKLVSVVAFMLLASLCLFATDSTVRFKMFHSVNSIDTHGFLFYDATRDAEISTADLTKTTATNDIQFARLMVMFNKKLTTGIKLDFTPLVASTANADGSYDCLPYEVWSYSRSNDKILGTKLKTESTSVAGANKDNVIGSINVFSTSSPLTLNPAISGAPELREIAMMYITLDMESAAAETYTGTVKAVFTSN